jgi:uncharacterized protein involved in oxidation of intracellular sulfur
MLSDIINFTRSFADSKIYNMAQKILILINDAPYGTEKAYNALRLALQLCRDNGNTEVRIFLMADAAGCALPGQNTPNGYYNIERMLKSSMAKGAKIKICGSCAEARGLNSVHLLEGTEISNMAELAEWVVESDKVITF